MVELDNEKDWIRKNVLLIISHSVHVIEKLPTSLEYSYRSEDKGQKLRDVWEGQQFLRAVEDVEVWIAEMETQLSSEDTGRDLISVNNLLKRHEVGGAAYIL